MNVQQKIIDYVRANPGSTSSQIAAALGTPRENTRIMLRQLCMTETLERTNYKAPFCYTIASAPDAAVGAEYHKRSQRAIELEQSRLWRRAAHQWLQVIDSTNVMTLRENAAQRRAYCIGIVACPVSYSGVPFAVTDLEIVEY
ncbi:PerC family transcriptional regulator [Mixta calida]|uniref:PerC family transcriptional regulator n=1 Tax=Mixta calida TaxID=665913 RepID=UPI0034D48E1F